MALFKPESRLLEKFALLGIYSLMGTGLVVSLSNAALSVFAGLSVLFWLLSGNFRQIPNLVKTNPVARVAMLLFGLFIVGLIYTSGELDDAFDYFKKYRELVLIAIFMTLLINHRHRQQAMNAFFFGTFLLMAASYFMYMRSILIWGDPTLIGRISHNIFMSFFAFWTAHKLLDAEKNKWWWALLLILIIVNIFFLVGGRTGQVVFIVLTMLFLWQRFQWQQRFFGFALLAIALSVFFLTSERFQDRINQIEENIQSYNSGDTYTDVGLRLEFMRNSFELLKERPIFGYGTGSFLKEYTAVAEERGDIPSGDPHNEYVLITVQLGLVGLGVFLALLIVQWRSAKRLHLFEERIAQGLVLTMAVACLANSCLFESLNGHFYAFFSAVLFSSLAEQEEVKKVSIET